MNLFLILLGVLLNAAAQLCIRKGMMMVGELSLTMSSISSSIYPMITNVYLWIGLLCCVLGVFAWMVVLSRVEVSYAYPFFSIGYVVVAILAYYFFGESLSLTKISGIIVICVGVYLISRS